MPITLPEEQAYELAPAGSHTAVCLRVVDLGTQAGMYGPKRQILISWELPDDQMADGPDTQRQTLIALASRN